MVPNKIEGFTVDVRTNLLRLFSSQVPNTSQTPEELAKLLTKAGRPTTADEINEWQKKGIAPSIVKYLMKHCSLGACEW